MRGSNAHMLLWRVTITALFLLCFVLAFIWVLRMELDDESPSLLHWFARLQMGMEAMSAVVIAFGLVTHAAPRDRVAELITCIAQARARPKR